MDPSVKKSWQVNAFQVANEGISSITGIAILEMISQDNAPLFKMDENGSLMSPMDYTLDLHTLFTFKFSLSKWKAADRATHIRLILNVGLIWSKSFMRSDELNTFHQLISMDGWKPQQSPFTSPGATIYNAPLKTDMHFNFLWFFT